MVVRKRQWKHHAGFEFTVDIHRFDTSARNAQNGYFGCIYNRSKGCSANSAKVCNGKATALHIGNRSFFVAGFFGQRIHFLRYFDHIQLVGIFNYRHNQSKVSIYRNAYIEIVLVNNFLRHHVHARIELRELFQRRSNNFHQNGCHSKFYTFFLSSFGIALTEFLKRGNIGLVELCDMRNGVPCMAQMFGRFEADIRHSLTFHLAKLRKVGQRLLMLFGTNVLYFVSLLMQQFAVSFHIVEQNSSAGTSAFYLIYIHADFASETANRWRCGRCILQNRRLIFHSYHFRCLGWFGCFRYKFGFSFDHHRSNRLHSYGLCSRSCCRCSHISRNAENYRSDRRCITFGHQHFGYFTGNGRRHFDGCFVGFHFEHSLVVFYCIAYCNKHFYNGSCANVFTQFGQRKLKRSGAGRRYGSSLWRRCRLRRSQRLSRCRCFFFCRLGRCSAFAGKHQYKLSDAYLFALVYLYFGNGSGSISRHFNGRFVRFEFQQRLIGFHHIARLHKHFDHCGAVYIFP